MAETTAQHGRAVLFRLEFGQAHGWGHLVRSGALAGELSARRWQCDLWTDSRVESVPNSLTEPFSRVLQPRAHVPPGYSWLVVDHYGTTDEQLRTWRTEFSGKIAVIDDEVRRRLDAADLVVNTRLGLVASPYPPGVATLLGERYALLRSGLRTPAEPEWQPSADLTPVLVILGGTDPTGTTEAVLEALADIDATSIVPVVVRPGGEEPSVLRRFPLAVWLGEVNAAELAGWAARCQFAVSAAGGTLYELAALGLPFVAVVVAENQVSYAEAVHSRWSLPCVKAGPSLRHDLAGPIRMLRGHAETARAALAGVDLRGAERVAVAMIQGCGA